MYESLYTVNRNNGNVILIFLEQLFIKFNIDLFQNKLIVTPCTHDCRFCFVAKMATWS